MAKVHTVVLAQVITSRMAAEVVLIATAEEIHSFCKLVSCVCGIVSHDC